MRRIFTTALTVLMAFSLMLSLSSTASANAITGGGYNSSYSGESVFTNQAAGQSGQFSAIFFNSGTTQWAAGVVGLLVCDSSKTNCNVASPNAAYASGWFSTTVYATVSATVADTVAHVLLCISPRRTTTRSCVGTIRITCPSLPLASNADSGPPGRILN